MHLPRVVLVEPQNPANVGFVARLIANFGVDQWAIVGGPEALEGDAQRTGAPARETLAAATVYSGLADSLDGCTHTLGFTAREGRHRRTIPLPGLKALQAEWGPEARVAMVFGREDRGLESEETESFTALCTIPTYGLGSLNLSHAVALALYEWFRGTPAARKTEGPFHPGDLRTAGKADANRDAAEVRWSTAAERKRVAERARAELLAAAFRDEGEHLEGMLRRLAALPIEARDLRMLEKIVRHARWLREGGEQERET